MAFIENNIMFIVTAVLSGAMLLWPLISRRVGKEIDTLVAVQLINYKEALVLDVREGSEYAAGHIPNSRHIPGDKLKDRLQELEKFKDKPIVVIYRGGLHSSRPSEVLYKNGFVHVHEIMGGIDAWERANLPMVKK